MASPTRNLPTLSLDAAKAASEAAQAKAKQMGIGPSTRPRLAPSHSSSSTTVEPV